MPPAPASSSPTAGGSQPNTLVATARWGAWPRALGWDRSWHPPIGHPWDPAGMGSSPSSPLAAEPQAQPHRRGWAGCSNPSAHPRDQLRPRQLPHEAKRDMVQLRTTAGQAPARTGPPAPRYLSGVSGDSGGWPWQVPAVPWAGRSPVPRVPHRRWRCHPAAQTRRSDTPPGVARLLSCPLHPTEMPPAPREPWGLTGSQHTGPAQPCARAAAGP